MSVEKKEYSNEEVTVVWKPQQCIHSTICWKGLIEVFNPKARPWVKIDGAPAERIIEQVRKCPSGALSYYLPDNKKQETNTPAIQAETASIVKVSVQPNGPYLLNTECIIVHSDGKEETKSGTVALCRCGASQNKPYCDGAHRKINFEG